MAPNRCSRPALRSFRPLAVGIGVIGGIALVPRGRTVDIHPHAPVAQVVLERVDTIDRDDAPLAPPLVMRAHDGAVFSDGHDSPRAFWSTNCASAINGSSASAKS